MTFYVFLSHLALKVLIKIMGDKVFQTFSRVPAHVINRSKYIHLLIQQIFNKHVLGVRLGMFVYIYIYPYARTFIHMYAYLEWHTYVSVIFFAQGSVT